MATAESRDAPFFEALGSGPTIESRNIARALHVNKSQLADVLGVGADSLRRANRERAARIQTRMRDMVEIINRAQPWAGSINQAFAWYRSQPLPSFGGATAEELVKDGKAEAVKAYLARINEGGYA
ncbi:antitoxin Xre/MbcA/ParS toxin-binding domain-containing protein [Salinisphaera sp. SPP-AMP-43]|uniref:antitoxin Xre/MbcA/ParS toxin-binding domain-containing protein n=1 Tax=Salinisphaera sp. SPP-AMP-43 TaxID=3121288 RepID=UPI003C6E6E9A